MHNLIMDKVKLAKISTLCHLLNDLAVVPLGSAFPVQLFNYIRLCLRKAVNTGRFNECLGGGPSSPVRSAVLGLTSGMSLAATRLIADVRRRGMVRGRSSVVSRLCARPRAACRALISSIRVRRARCPILRTVTGLCLGGRVAFRAYWEGRPCTGAVFRGTNYRRYGQLFLYAF